LPRDLKVAGVAIVEFAYTQATNILHPGELDIRNCQKLLNKFKQQGEATKRE
jgi:hypothetical protein